MQVATLDHPFFGLCGTAGFTTEEVCWEKEIAVNGSGVDVALWAPPDAPMRNELDKGELDQMADAVQQLATLDEQARRHLLDYLDDDDAFIRHHLEEADAFPRVAELFPSGSTTPPDFAQALQLVQVGLWLGHPDPIVMDYMIDPDHSDQVLAVKLGADGSLASIDWES